MFALILGLLFVAFLFAVAFHVALVLVPIVIHSFTVVCVIIGALRLLKMI